MLWGSFLTNFSAHSLDGFVLPLRNNSYFLSWEKLVKTEKTDITCGYEAWWSSLRPDKRLEQCKAVSQAVGSLVRLILWQQNSDLLSLQFDLLWWPKSINVGILLSPSRCGILSIGEVIWNMTYFPCFLSLFQANTLSHTHTHTNTCTPTVKSEERFGKLQNLHSSLFKQHLFSNDGSTLRGEWESIFNWMFTWGITSTIWIRLLDHMHFGNSWGCLSFWSYKLLPKNLKNTCRKEKKDFKSHKIYHISP